MNIPTRDKAHILSVNVQFHDKKEGQKLPAAQAYLFNRVGQLVDAKSVSTELVTFEIDPNQKYRVIVGPHLVTTDK